MQQWHGLNHSRKNEQKQKESTYKGELKIKTRECI